MIKICASLILLLLLHICSFAQTTANRIDSVLHARYTNNTFNGNIAVIRKGKFIYKKAWGYEDLQKKKPLDLNSVFYLGSVSKQFTAICVMILKSKGYLNYDDPVVQYIPGFPFQNVTIRHLLTHTSGINDYITLDYEQWKKFPAATDKDVVNMIRSYFDTLRFEPGSSFFYSNSNYALLVNIIEKVSGLTYSQFLSQNVFKKLKMRDSFVKTDKNISGRIVTGYIKNDSTQLFELPDSLNSLSGSPTAKIIGGGGIFSTLPDLYKWDQALYTEKLAPCSILNEAFAPFSFVNGTKSKYGFGWNIYYRENGDTVMRHAGQFTGYLSLITRNITRKESIIILTNFTGDNDINHLASLMMEIETILETGDQ